MIGCGSSWFMATCYASLRETAGHGLTDAYTASEYLETRSYDRIVVMSRSGTTTEVLELLESVRGAARTTAITNTPGTPILDLADDPVLLEFANDHSVVATRSATTSLVMLRATLGHDPEALAHDAARALGARIDSAWLSAKQFTFLGRGWTLGLAHEAALKMRESAQAWTESYPSMEYRHGPISVAEPGRSTWIFGEPPAGLVEQIAATGATLVEQDPSIDPLAQLVLVQRLAAQLADDRGVDPDQPRHLSRSVILS
jgi:fructoselysine-6-P-deglycase FrlB-like protein